MDARVIECQQECLLLGTSRHGASQYSLGRERGKANMAGYAAWVRPVANDPS